MEIQVQTEFPIKITIIDEDIATNLIFHQIWPIVGPSLGKMLSKIDRFEWITEFSNIYHGNTHSERDSSKNDDHCWWYCQKCNFATKLDHI